MNYKAVIFVLLITALSIGCSLRHNEYSYYRTFDDARWAYGDSLAITPEIEDSACQGRLAVCLRHTNAYPYSNLWLELKYPVNDSVYATDTLEIKLADEYGRWYGKGTGVSYQLADTVIDNFTMLNHKPIQLRHIMRADTLDQIEQVGISFTPIKNEKI